jgi:hypothetical protein
LSVGFLSASAPLPIPAQFVSFGGLSGGVPTVHAGHELQDAETVFAPPMVMKVATSSHHDGTDADRSAKGGQLVVQMADGGQEVQDTKKKQSPTVMSRLGGEPDALAASPEEDLASQNGMTLVRFEHYDTLPTNLEALGALHGQSSLTGGKGFLGNGDTTPNATEVMRFEGSKDGLPVVRMKQRPLENQLVPLPAVPMRVRLSAVGANDGGGVKVRTTKAVESTKAKRVDI